jgi:uncharacterized protein (TIGR02246 family)
MVRARILMHVAAVVARCERTAEGVKMSGYLHYCRFGIVVLVLAPGVRAAYGQVPSASTVSEVRAAIGRGNAQYVEAFADADADAVALVFDPDGTRLEPGGIVVRGQRAIRDDVAEFLERAGSVIVTIETADLWLVDDLAYETGVRTYTYVPSGENERTVGGRFVTVWKRQQDGGWKIAADMQVPGT